MTNWIGEVIAGILKPIGNIFEAREARKAARESARAKLRTAQQETDAKLDLNDQELEQIMAAAKKDTWLDEYVTISLVSILNGVVGGAIAAAFGYTQILEGIALAVTTLVQMGVDVGFLMEAVILAAAGLVVWRKI